MIQKANMWLICWSKYLRWNHPQEIARKLSPWNLWVCLQSLKDQNASLHKSTELSSPCLQQNPCYPMLTKLHHQQWRKKMVIHEKPSPKSVNLLQKVLLAFLPKMNMEALNPPFCFFHWMIGLSSSFTSLSPCINMFQVQQNKKQKKKTDREWCNELNVFGLPLWRKCEKFQFFKQEWEDVDEHITQNENFWKKLWILIIKNQQVF